MERIFMKLLILDELKGILSDINKTKEKLLKLESVIDKNDRERQVKKLEKKCKKMQKRASKLQNDLLLTMEGSYDGFEQR